MRRRCSDAFESPAPRNLRPSAHGFTLVEMMAAMAVFLLIMTLVLSITNQTSKIWKDSSSKIQAFQNARSAYNTMAARLRQATLNTYLDYYDTSVSPPVVRTDANAATFVPTGYGRNSQLHFITDRMKNLISVNEDLYPGHAVFFQAPLGFTQNSTTYGKLPNDLNACGYYVEFNTDKPYFPSFLGSITAVQERYRYRLMEFMQPTESLAVYSTPASGSPGVYNRWFTNFLPPNVTLANAPIRVLAENIIALVILPQHSERDKDPSGSTPPPLAPDFAYDSRAKNLHAPNYHQLPPLVRLIMVAIDEPSAQRLNPNGNSTPPTSGLGIDINTLFEQEAKLDGDSGDLKKLTDSLSQNRINYRLFDTTISIRGARWSTEL